MRAIICRGRNRTTGEWVTGAYFERFGESYIRDRGLDIEVDPDTVGEYTGCEDKKGKDIYEGDTVALTANRRLILGKIEFINGAFVIRSTADEKHRPTTFILGDIEDRMYGGCVDDVEVIDAIPSAVDER